MIVPFLNMTIHGSIWYQGEDNAEHHYLSYNCSFPAMVDDWRAKWYSSTRGNTDPVFPFGFVQVRMIANGSFLAAGAGLRHMFIIINLFIL